MSGRASSLKASDRALLAKLEDLTARVAEDLRWSGNLGYDAPRAGRAGPGQKGVTRRPTESIGDSQQLVRDRHRKAMESVRDAIKALQEADESLGRLYGAVERQTEEARRVAEGGLPPDRLIRSDFSAPTPVTASKADKREAARARDRRRARGEGYGVS